MARREEPVRVLCVDDDDALRSLLPDMLERTGVSFTVETVGDPTAVLETVRDGRFDCIVCDYDMPGLDGLGVLANLRTEYPDLPFILYTGKGSEAIASEAISAGVTDYIQKDSGSDHYELLANRIAEYAERYRAEERAELSEERYRRLVEQSVVGIGLSQDGVFRYVNPTFASLFDYETSELVGKPVLDIIDEADHDRVEGALVERESGDVDSVHYVVTAKDRHGTRFDVEVNGSRVSYEGEPAVLGVVQPLATRRKALATVERSALESLRSQLGFAVDALTDADPDVPAARDAVQAARRAVEVEAEAGGEPPGGATVDIAARATATWAGNDLPDGRLTVEGSRTANGPESLVDGFLAGLWDAWRDTGDEVAVTLSGSDEGFEVAVTAVDGEELSAPPDPPSVSSAAELLGWDVLVDESGEGVVYEVRGVGTE